MLISQSKALSKKFPECFDNVRNFIVYEWFQQIINSKYRTAVFLTNWLKEQVDNPTDAINRAANEIDSFDDYDDQMYAVFQWVYNNIAYLGDITKWGMTEHWNTADETLTANINGYPPMSGDCEDGAVLMYVLARLKGIPSNRIYIWGGNVDAGGHACLFYKRMEYPYNYVYIDWCYYPSLKLIPKRNLLTLVDKTIKEETIDDAEVYSRYRNTWLIFNEDFSSCKLRRK